MHKSLIIITIFTLIVISCSSPKDNDADNRLPKKEMESLELAMLDAGKYAAAARRPVDSLRRLTELTKDDAEASGYLAHIAHQMSAVSNDTAVKYANEALRRAELSGNDSIINTARLARFYAYSTGGIFNLAEQQLADLQGRKISEEQRAYLWRVARQMYSYAQMYTESNFDVSHEFHDKSMAYSDSLLTVLPEKSQLRRFITAERRLNEGNYREAKGILDSLINDMKPGDPMYGMVAFQMAQYYKHREDDTNYGRYLAKAAESDIRTGVREGLALFTFANWLYDKGMVNDAFRYINFAMNEAMEGNARMRAVNIATMLPMIDQRYRESARHEHELYVRLFIICAVALVVAMVFVVLLVIQGRRSRKERSRIAALSQARERQLGHFLALCSSYYHKLFSLQMMVSHKIASGQTKELMKLLKSGKFNTDESEEIFSNFDRSFMEIYPDFIEQINHLLRAEERFTLSGNDTLPAELRIYALVTMGITESQRIARILNYSIHTVYTYRNKMRNKAIDRDRFEEAVAAIEPFEEV